MSSRRSSEEVDVFQGPSTQELGDEREECVVYHITLKRVRYGSHSSTDSSPTSHLQWISEKVRTIRAGTLDKLVEALAPEPKVMEVSQAYRTCFLSTYRCFAGTGEVVDLIVKRYTSLVDSEEEDDEAQKKNKTFIRKDILAFLRQWFDTCPQDFTSPLPNPHLAKLLPLVQESPELTKVAAAMEDKVKEEERKTTLIRGGPNGVSTMEDEGKVGEEGEDQRGKMGEKPVQSPLFGLSTEKFADALTSEDARLFRQVQPPQCLDYIRRPKDTSNAPTLRASIEHFNKVSLVVIATVLGGVAPDSRAYIIKQWLEIAQHCRGVKNFSSLKAIMSGLQSTPVYRLRKTWEQLSSSKLQLFEELSGLLSAEGNHQTSRDLLNREGTAKYADVQPKKKSKRHEKQQQQSLVGVVPYLGTFLTDLTMVHTAYPDRTEDGLINFEKFRKLFELLAQLTLYQKSASNYCLGVDHRLLHWLSHTHTLSPSESHTLSKDLEPDNSPSPTQHSHGNTLTIPDIVTTTVMPTSPSKKRRHQILQMFGVKGSTVGDYSPPHVPQQSHSASSSPSHSPSHSPSSLKIANSHTMSISASNITKLDYSCKTMPRSLSVTPDASRRRQSMTDEFLVGGVSSYIVRVVMEKADSCVYKSLLVGTGDKGHYVIKQSLEKHGLSAADFKQYDLFQVTKGKRRPQIPRGGNVFYALDTSEAAQPITILLSSTPSKQK